MVGGVSFLGSSLLLWDDMGVLVVLEVFDYFVFGGCFGEFM